MNEHNEKEPRGLGDLGKQLDECVRAARKAQETGDWEEADKEAEKLDAESRWLLRAVKLNVILNVIAAVNGVVTQDYMTMVLSIGVVWEGFIFLLCKRK